MKVRFIITPKLRGGRLRYWGPLLALLFTGSFAWSQESLRMTAPDLQAEASPDLLARHTLGQGDLTATPPALFDLQFWYHATDTAMGDAGMAAAQFINGEFWVSRWQSDTLYRFDSNGSLVSEFTIPGLTGTRSLASDGTYLYAANASNTIRQINPVSQTLTGVVINSTANATARHCSYDSTLDNGNGGFWVGNFTTDITAISMAGTVISVIPVATHGLNGMYGSAFDNVSAGGPYLWVFAQNGANQSQLHRLSLPSGMPTAVTYDVYPDFAAQANLISGLAGGLFITDQLVPNQWTLGGLLQGDPNNVLFGYELSDPTLTGPDAQPASISNGSGLTRVPESQVLPDFFTAEVANAGLVDIDTAYIDFQVRFGGNLVYSNTQFGLNIPSGSSVPISSGVFNPTNGVGTYEVSAIARLGANQADTFPTNDTTMFVFEVSDSTFARDDDISNGVNYTITAADYAYAAVQHTLGQFDTLTSIWTRTNEPIHGDTILGVVFELVNGVPGALLGTTPPYMIDSAQNEYLMTFNGGISLAPGEYIFGVYQQVGGDMALTQSNNIFTPGVNFFYINGSGWFASSIETARFIRPNFGIPSTMVGLEEELAQRLQVVPNPSTGVFKLLPEAAVSGEVLLEVFDLQGKQLLREEHWMGLGQELPLDLSHLRNGIYQVSLTGTTISKQVAKVMVAH